MKNKTTKMVVLVLVCRSTFSTPDWVGEGTYNCPRRIEATVQKNEDWSNGAYTVMSGTTNEGQVISGEELHKFNPQQQIDFQVDNFLANGSPTFIAPRDEQTVAKEDKAGGKHKWGRDEGVPPLFDGWD